MGNELVRQMIETWLSERPNRSLAKLVKNSGISDSTLRRLREGSSTPGFDTLVDLGRATGNHAAALEAIAHYFPQHVEFAEKGFEKNSNSEPVVEARAQAQDLMGILETPDSTRIFLLLVTRMEITREFVEQRFGKYGISVLEAVAESGFARTDDNETYRLNVERFSYPSAASVLRVGQHLMNSFDLNDLGTPVGRLVVLTERLSEDAANRVNKVIQNCAIEVKEIVDDPASAGELSVAVSLVMQSVK